MKKRHIIIAAIMSIAPGLATSANVDVVTNNPQVGMGILLVAPAVRETPVRVDFATVEATHSSPVVQPLPEEDSATRLRRAAWLLGPAIMAVITIARRRDPKCVKPG